MCKLMIIRGHDEIEKSGADSYYIDQESDYDLYKAVSEEAGKYHGAHIKLLKAVYC